MKYKQNLTLEEKERQAYILGFVEEADTLDRLNDYEGDWPVSNALLELGLYDTGEKLYNSACSLSAELDKYREIIAELKIKKVKLPDEVKELISSLDD